MLRTIGARALLGRLEELAASVPSKAIAFDGDGTLWSGDVGEDIFHHALRERLLKAEALPALRAAATRHALSSDGDANDVARRIFDAYVAGKFPEREVCSVMTWCYAGFSAADFADYCRHVLSAQGIGERLHRELEPVLDWCRSARIRLVVVSASPRGAVEAAAGLWGFTSKDVAASTPLEQGGQIAAGTQGEVPYAEAKVGAARGLFGDSDWLASFGDNVFDVEMLQAARIGIAVRPKVGLRTRLPELENVHLLEG
ncbi:MAG TPA: HAD family hydrolase [Polyangiaceae bacterium]|nr:HAD family hydrolase [Polyangiaceae bacterium]